MSTALLDAAKAIAAAKNVVAITGAGISVESGIPDFRSPGGIWDTYPPEQYATIDAFLNDPDRVWAMWYDLGAMLGDVRPNPGHLALTQLQKAGRLQAIITQNIDNLHQEAGSSQVIEYHGNARKMRCLDCGRSIPLNMAERTDKAPHCPCSGLMKPDVVLFGEFIPETAIEDANHMSETADVVLIIGTSATVYPAAQLPVAAKQRGAYIIECNLEATDFTTTITDTFLEGAAGTTLPALADAVDRLLVSKSSSTQ